MVNSLLWVCSITNRQKPKTILNPTHLNLGITQEALDLNEEEAPGCGDTQGRVYAEHT